MSCIGTAAYSVNDPVPDHVPDHVLNLALNHVLNLVLNHVLNLALYILNTGAMSPFIRRLGRPFQLAILLYKGGQ
jgi:hypothetical protein